MVNVDDRGARNTLVFPQNSEHIQGHVVIAGDDNYLEIGDGSISSGMYVYMGSASRLRIGKHCNLGDLFVHVIDRGEVLVGSRSGFNGRVRLLLHEPGRIKIGNDCLFAGEVDVTISDMHSIVTMETGERVNPARDVVLEDHVWVGQRAMILKGTHAGKDSIIGACSLLSGAVPANCVAAGIPARVIRTGVTWRHELI